MLPVVCGHSSAISRREISTVGIKMNLELRLPTPINQEIPGVNPCPEHLKPRRDAKHPWGPSALLISEFTGCIYIPKTSLARAVGSQAGKIIFVAILPQNTTPVNRGQEKCFHKIFLSADTVLGQVLGLISAVPPKACSSLHCGWDMTTS